MYSFGSFQAFRQESPSHDNKKGVKYQISSEHMEPNIRMSFASWTKNKELEYRLLHKYEDHAPHYSYVLVHKNIQKHPLTSLQAPQGKNHGCWYPIVGC